MGGLVKWKETLLAIFACFTLSFTAQAQTDPHAEPITIEDFNAAPEANADAALDAVHGVVPDERLDRALDILAADEDLQTERPEWTPEPMQFKTRSPPNAFFRAIAGFFQAISETVGYILMAVIAVAIAAALYFILGESLTLRGRQKLKKIEPDISEMPDMRPEEAAAIALLEDADALAAAGRFAEAVHLLLFRSIGDIQEKQQGSVPRSLTAREIGTLDTLPGRVRAALSPIITIVERSFFGGREVDSDGWQAARQSYQDFAFGEAWA